jgi:hypothetical protein
MSLQKTAFKVGDFAGWQKANTLELSPRFQRRSVWKLGAKSYLIDTILRGFPVPIIFMRDRGTDPKTFEPRREVVDGQQRLRTVLGFVSPKLLEDFDPARDAFVVSKAHNPEAADKKFRQLDAASQQAILNYEFSVQVLPASMDDREIVQLFRRLNSTNYSLNKQELRNACFYGHFKSSAFTLAAEQLHRWRSWKTFSDDDISRMHEVELTSECMASLIEGKILSKSPTRLDNIYDQFDATFPYRNEVERRFHSTMDEIAGNFATLRTRSPLLKKRLIYTLLIVVTDALFGLSTSLSKHPPPKRIPTNKWNKLGILSDKLEARSAPKSVLEATDRRTTHPKERRLLFDYLRKCF